MSGQMIQLIQEIKVSIQRDIEPVLKGYRNKNNWIDDNVPGFWTILRMLFPEIDGLGRLRYGRTIEKGVSGDAVKFMREYFPRPEYKQISGFIYNVYRHGLLHSHYPKQMIIDGRNRGWAVNFRLTGQEVPLHLKFMINSTKEQLSIDGQAFYEDLLSAIDKYIQDFSDSKKEPELQTNFRAAYQSMVAPEKEAIARKRSFIQNSDFDFFKI